jgi:integrase
VSPLRQALADYLAVRRSLGYKLAGAERLLGQFIAYLEERGEQTIRAELALAWATLPANAHPSWPWLRLSVVRGFAAHMKTIDPATEVPASGLLPRRRRRRAPYLYSEEQVDALIVAAGTLKTEHRVATYRTLLGLLAVTGMRVGEAIRLDRDDIDFQAELIVVRHTKFNKSRELALHGSAARALHGYLERADRPRGTRSTEAVFVSTAGTRLLYSNVASTFRLLVARGAIAPRSTGGKPSLHDLRHSFAVRTILDGYRGGAAVEERLAALSTYLGHADPADTYWYLSAAPELMGLAAERLERHLGGRS